ncbi:MAG: hypothetical protein MRY21_00950 [Simkaniaceae bacterium]|nr:hypothetical protein [Simkaniaceae bacterium]
MKKVFLFLIAFTTLFSKHAIVFVHLGREIPSYVQTAIDQAALFNKACPIYFVGNSKPVLMMQRRPQAENVTLVAMEKLQFATEHRNFVKRAKLNRRFRGGFWLYATQRFFVLADLMRAKQLENVFQVESDNMIYVDFSKLLPVFEKNYPHIGATFDDDLRCVPSVVYFKNAEAAEHLRSEMLNNALRGMHDMRSIAKYRFGTGKARIKMLPIFPTSYARNEDVRSPKGRKPRSTAPYHQHFHEFGSIFDACALGHYLGGEDPRNGSKGTGFINETSIFIASNGQYTWEHDEEGRKIPYLHYRGEKIRINNLHIHAKNLQNFRSR